VLRRVAVGLLWGVMCAVVPASAAGARTGVFTLPAGGVVTLTHTELLGCDPTEWGYELGSGPWRVLGAKRQTCAKAGPFGRASIADVQSDVTVGPFPATRRLRLFLVDEFPTPFTFFSDDAEHTSITQIGRASWRVAENDSNFGRYGPFDPNAPTPGRGNFRTTLTILEPDSS
jgi:hypothetical protein